MSPQARLAADGAASQNKTGRSPLFSAIDKITLAYCAWIIIYTIYGGIKGKIDDTWTHPSRHLLIMVLIFLMAWTEQRMDLSSKPKLLRTLRFIRGIYPVLLFTYFYSSLHSVSRIIFPEYLDPWFMELDRKIWGYLPSQQWGRMFNHWFVQESLYLSYFSYYPMILGLPVYLYVKNRPAFRELIFNLTLVFYLCYVFYSLVPVVGGRIMTDALELTQTYRGGIFTRVMAFIYRNSGHWGGAFPSSHVAIAVVLTIAALRYNRIWGYLFCVISLFLTFATVYCHYHWFVDAVAGVFTGILGYFAGNWLRQKIQREQR